MKFNNSVKLLALITLIAALASLSGCGKKAEMSDAYEYDDLSKYIKLAEYKGLEYESAGKQVSDSEVQAYIDQAVSNTGTKSENREGTVTDNSVVNIDYVGSLNGVEFDGGSATGVELDIADSNFIAGFAEALVGHKAGENFDIDVTFPENYGNEELAGQPAVFNITLNYIVETEVPEYNDEWVKNNTTFDNTKDYEASIKEELLNDKASSSENDAKLSIFNQIFENSEVIEYPEKEYNEKYEKLTSSYKKYAEANDMEFEDYLKDEMGITLEQFEKLAKEASEEAVKRELVLLAIAREENMELSDKDYNDYLISVLDDAGYTEKSYKDEKGYTIQEYAEQNDLYVTYLYQRVMDKVMEFSVQK